jgi:ElaB/YqjD/DUF883 family membrane-anchored ribosome-binding protein
MDNFKNESLTYGQAATQTQRSGSTLDNIKSTVADKLRTAASAVQNKAASPNQNSTISEYGNQASDWLNRSADYVRDLDVNQVKSNVQTEVRRNPGRSLLIAGVAGLILGAIFRRR